MPARPKFNPNAIDTSVFGTIRKASGTARSEDVPVTELDPSLIRPNPYQPRMSQNPAANKELEASIEDSLGVGGPGIHEPLVVRPTEEGYQLVAGGRRLAAALRVGMTTVPVVVRSYSDEEARSVALIENLQRENLAFDDEASALAQLKKASGWPATTIAKKIGKSADYVDVRLQAAGHPDLMARYMSGEVTIPTMITLIRERKAGREVADSVRNGIEGMADSVPNGIVNRPSSQPRRPHNAYRPLDAALTTLAKLSAAPLDNDERLELRRRALKIREAADRVLEQLGDEE